MPLFVCWGVFVLVALVDDLGYVDEDDATACAARADGASVIDLTEFVANRVA